MRLIRSALDVVRAVATDLIWLVYFAIAIAYIAWQFRVRLLPAAARRYGGINLTLSDFALREVDGIKWAREPLARLLSFDTPIDALSFTLRDVRVLVPCAEGAAADDVAREEAIHAQSVRVRLERVGVRDFDVRVELDKPRIQLVGYDPQFRETNFGWLLSSQASSTSDGDERSQAIGGAAASALFQYRTVSVRIVDGELRLATRASVIGPAFAALAPATLELLRVHVADESAPVATLAAASSAALVRWLLSLALRLGAEAHARGGQGSSQLGETLSALSRLVGAQSLPSGAEGLAPALAARANDALSVLAHAARAAEPALAALSARVESGASDSQPQVLEAARRAVRAAESVRQGAEGAHAHVAGAAQQLGGLLDAAVPTLEQGLQHLLPHEQQRALATQALRGLGTASAMLQRAAASAQQARAAEPHGGPAPAASAQAGGARPPASPPAGDAPPAPSQAEDLLRNAASLGLGALRLGLRGNWQPHQ